MDTVSVAKRLMRSVEFSPDGCWLWTASQNGDGYSQLGVGSRVRGAHRVSYELFVGEIPEGLQVDHLCRVRHCVNPTHLEAVTQRENILRGESCIARNAKVTHCPQGHPYDAENTLHSAGRRWCRACSRATSRRTRARRARGKV